MIGLFFHDSDYDKIDFEQLESKGVTDVFANGLHPPHSPYNDYKDMITNIYGRIETTNLNLWSDFTPLYLDGWQPPNNTLQTIVDELLHDILSENCFELAGISFDDFAYDHTIWTGSNTVLEGTDEEILLTSFAEHQHDVIHEYGKQLIINGPIENGRGLYVPNISKVVDYYAPQLYKNHTYNECNTNAWIVQKLKQTLNQTTNKNIIPLLITYDTNNALRSVVDVEGQIRSVLKYVDDYILFYEDYFDYNTRLYKRKTEMVSLNLLVKMVRLV